MQNDSKRLDWAVPASIAIFIGSTWITTWADELVYTPVNPAFGGNTLNGSWLLSNAQSQDTFEDPDTKSDDLSSESDIDKFNDTIERIALSRIASQLVSKFLDGEASSLETDNLILEITEDPTTGSTTIKTTDKGTGYSTIIDLGFIE